MSDERRKHPRVTGDEEARPCLLRGPDGGEETFDLMDLSESGARLRCARSIPAMTRIGVALTLPAERVGRDSAAQLQTMGVVVWSHEVEPGRFDTGVFFPELDPESRSILQAYVLSAA